jgi:hypothetical protein
LKPAGVLRLSSVIYLHLWQAHATHHDMTHAVVPVAEAHARQICFISTLTACAFEVVTIYLHSGRAKTYGQKNG